MFTYGQLKTGVYYRRTAGREGGGRTYYFQRLDVDSAGTVKHLRYSLNDGAVEWCKYSGTNHSSEVVDWISPELPDQSFIDTLPPLPVSTRRAHTVVKEKPAAPPPAPPPPVRAQLLSNNRYYIPHNKAADKCARCNNPTEIIPLSANDGMRYCPKCEA